MTRRSKAESRLVLASASPRRRELLAASGHRAVIHVCHVEEPSRRPAFIPVELWPMTLAYIKAHHVQARLRDPRAIVIGADTIVFLNGEILGKPRNVAHARKMLAQLSGRKHQVITGLALLRGSQLRLSRSISVCRIKRLSRPWLNAYLASQLWQGKAGAYGIQDKDCDPVVTLLSGEWSNVVGLPMKLLESELRALKASSD